jgi:hypothetical protein
LEKGEEEKQEEEEKKEEEELGLQLQKFRRQ